MPTVRGIANWSRVHTPDKYDNFSILVDVPDDFPKVLKAQKVQSQCSAIDHDKASETHNPKAMFAFNFKKSKFLRSGAEVPGPSVVDAGLNPMLPSVLIGNGSEVMVQYHTYPQSADPTKHSIVLDGVQIINLVKYEGKAREAAPSEFTATEGYVADESGDI